MERFTIKSAVRDRELRFEDCDSDYFTVGIHGRHIAATKRVWGYEDTGNLVTLFQSIADDWRGWKGEKKWGSIEGDLELSARSSTLGIIRLDIRLRNFEMDDDWEVSAPIFIEPGSLGLIVRGIQKFFRANDSKAEPGAVGNE